MTTLGYGIVGCGRIARSHARAISRLSGGALVAVADPERAKAERLASEFPSRPAVYGSSEELLADPSVQVVVVAAPTHLHRDETVAAAAAGKHVYCEKAMAATPRQCREMMEAARRHRVKLTIGQCTRFMPACVMARRLVDSGRIGEPFAVDAQFATVAEPASRGATDSWRYRAGSAGSGHLINFGCHYVDTARYFLGRDPESVSAHVANLFSPMIPEDQFSTIAVCGGGRLISIGLSSSFSGVRSPYEGYTIRGTEGLLHVDWPNRRVTLAGSDRTAAPVDIDAELLAEDGFERLHRLFRDAIESGGEVPLDGETAMLDLEWSLAAYLSSALRRWVDLPLGVEHDDFAGPVVERTIPATRE